MWRQYAQGSKQWIMNLDTCDCICIERKPRGRVKLQQQLSDDLAYPKKNPRQSLIALGAEKTIHAAHSRTWVVVQSSCTGTALLQTYTPCCEKISSIAATGVVCVKPNVPFKILFVNKRNKVPKLNETLKVASLTFLQTKTKPTATCTAELLGLSWSITRKLKTTIRHVDQREKDFRQKLGHSAHLRGT